MSLHEWVRHLQEELRQPTGAARGEGGLLSAPTRGLGLAGRSSQTTFLRWVDSERETDSKDFEKSKTPQKYNTLAAQAAERRCAFPTDGLCIRGLGGKEKKKGEKKIPNTFTFGKLKGGGEEGAAGREDGLVLSLPSPEPRILFSLPACVDDITKCPFFVCQ